MSKHPKIGFIGQGYVGKNYADYFEKRGFRVVRYSLDEPYVKNRDLIKSCDIVFIGVPTPTTPLGFDDSIVREAVSLVGKNKVAVIKSTILPGTTISIQKSYPNKIVLYSPEFLSESTAKYDVAHPFSNIVGTSKNTLFHKKMAKLVNKIVPSAPFQLVCSSTEAEIIKYSHNSSGYVQIVLFNMIYDLAQKLKVDWDKIEKALVVDPLISSRYARPLHKGGRGAGGHCFIKDFAAFSDFYGKKIKNKNANSIFKFLAQKNIELLLRSGKDSDLLRGVYGKTINRKLSL